MHDGTLAIEVSGNVVNVTLLAKYNGFPMYFPCVAGTLGPLAAGTYEVNFSSRDVDTGVTQFLQSQQLQVIDAATEPIPTLSTMALILLAGLIAIGAMLRRRSRQD